MNPCNCPGCPEEIEWKQIFCRAHFARLPGPIRRTLTRASKLVGYNAVDEYRAAKNDAINFLNSGKTVVRGPHTVHGGAAG